MWERAWALESAEAMVQKLDSVSALEWALKWALK
jgi:hypothetical protein